MRHARVFAATHGLAAAAVAGALAWGCAMAQAPVAGTGSGAGTAAAAQPLVVRIGNAAPLSGALASLGQDEENGVRLAIETLNARGLRIGARAVRWELAAGDDGGHPARAVALAQRFCGEKVAAVIGHLQSGTSLPAAKVYHDCGLVNITPAAGHPAITRSGYDTSFRVIADDGAMMDKLAEYAAGRLAVKTVAVVEDGTAYGQGLVELLRDAADDSGLKLTEISTPGAKPMASTQAMQARPAEPGHAAAIGMLRVSHPDAVFFAGLDTEAAALLKQLGQAAQGDPRLARIRILGGDAMCTERLARLAAGEPLLGNVSCVLSGVAADGLREGGGWSQRYARRFPGVTPVFSPYAYDATMALARAMVDADSAQPQAFLPYLRRTDYQGQTGRIAFTAQGDLQEPTVTVYGFADGKRFQKR